MLFFFERVCVCVCVCVCGTHGGTPRRQCVWTQSTVRRVHRAACGESGCRAARHTVQTELWALGQFLKHTPRGMERYQKLEQIGEGVCHSRVLAHVRRRASAVRTHLRRLAHRSRLAAAFSGTPCITSPHLVSPHPTSPATP